MDGWGGAYGSNGNAGHGGFDEAAATLQQLLLLLKVAGADDEDDFGNSRCVSSRCVSSRIPLTSPSFTSREDEAPSGRHDLWRDQAPTQAASASSANVFQSRSESAVPPLPLGSVQRAPLRLHRASPTAPCLEGEYEKQSEKPTRAESSDWGTHGSTRTGGSVHTPGRSRCCTDPSEGTLTRPWSALSGPARSQGSGGCAPLPASEQTPREIETLVAQELGELQRRLRQREDELFSLRQSVAEMAEMRMLLRHRDDEVARLHAHLAATQEELIYKAAQLQERDDELASFRCRR